MKKVLIIALAILPVLFACKKSGTATDTTLETPKFAKEAAKVEIKNPINVTAKGQTVALQAINFMRSGRYVAKGTITKATETIVLTGTYTVTNGTYSMTGDVSATVTITTSGSEDTVTVNGETSPADVTESNIQEGSTQDKICRTWKLDHMILDFAKLGGKARYENMAEIVNDIKNHNIELSAENEQKIKNHEIKEITLDEGVICVTFANADAFMGSWNLSGSSFSYNFENFEGSLFSGSASGTVDFSGEKAIISVNLTTSIEKLGNGSAELTLVQVK